MYVHVVFAIINPLPTVKTWIASGFSSSQWHENPYSTWTLNPNVYKPIPNWKSANQTDYRTFNSERVGFCKNCMWGYEIRTTTILYAKWLSRLLRNYMKEQTGFGAHLDFLNILIKKNGEGGIWTHGTNCTQTFEIRTLSHSDTSPFISF